MTMVVDSKVKPKDKSYQENASSFRYFQTDCFSFGVFFTFLHWSLLLFQNSVLHFTFEVLTNACRFDFGIIVVVCVCL